MKRRKPLLPGKPLARTSELKRTELKRGTPLRNGPVKARRQKDTGPVKSVKDLVKERAEDKDGVLLCEVCGDVPGTNMHHRQPRGMGGCPEPYINEPSNLLWVCGHGNSVPGCHAVIENGRTYAKAVGWLVPRPTPPIEVPVLRRGVLVYLDDKGGIEPAKRGAA